MDREGLDHGAPKPKAMEKHVSKSIRTRAGEPLKRKKLKTQRMKTLNLKISSTAAEPTMTR